MSYLVGFIFENSVVSSASIFSAAIMTALVCGKFLTSLGLVWFVRVMAYSIPGAAAGLWQYSAFRIPGRSIELLEGLTLGLGMFLYCSIVVGYVTFIRDQNRVRDVEHLDTDRHADYLCQTLDEDQEPVIASEGADPPVRVQDGLSKEDIEYLKWPIPATDYMEKYRVNGRQLGKAIRTKEIRFVEKDGVMWVQDTSIY